MRGGDSRRTNARLKADERRGRGIRVRGTVTPTVTTGNQNTHPWKVSVQLKRLRNKIATSEVKKIVTDWFVLMGLENFQADNVGFRGNSMTVSFRDYTDFKCAVELDTAIPDDVPARGIRPLPQ
uniref:Uncharacterized protein n=1 Tax=Chromera velia CCMP2878 TaxID=1169474 RepID=A0A0K6SAD5_9ALVE|eukprot:Cvel_34433.t1-p1 / transcript=Cvel_34433.t1 / gene=Cvel_34433 / organism=Chromera_velia_CCMP2878 / gene_product=hypothetical protein / transcript_product=hypothetical protein / location=Cvel_scaffold5914:2471-3860(-) / protein_length=123 / sequence_SO=supercontig / SO=protein_coding / is_pseudo=false